MEHDPRTLLQRLKAALPRSFHGDLVIVGSVAVACHFSRGVGRNPVNTKDADVVVRPAGSVDACRRLATVLLRLGWRHRREPGFEPQARRASPAPKPYIKLNLPGGEGFFLEFLGIPRKDEAAPKREVDLELEDGWYALPVFRFMRLVTTTPLVSSSGLRYAAPSMMALANLLSHPTIGSQRMSYDNRLRSAKDLGRVLAIAHLSERTELETWPSRWRKALAACFPRSWRRLVPEVDGGLRSLFENRRAIQDAIESVSGLGLLRGTPVTEPMLRATAEQLQLLAIRPLKDLAGSRGASGAAESNGWPSLTSSATHEGKRGRR